MTAATGLQGNWTHSYEEDEGDIEVYRPSDGFAFPPSRRGRDTLNFGAEGSMSSSTAGPDDRQQHTSGAVTPLESNRYRFEAGATGASEIEVVSVEADRLRLRRQK